MNMLQKLQKYPREELREIVNSYGLLPKEAIFMGNAYDKRPMLLNMDDSTPGFVLAIGDAGSGKTGFLKTVAYAASETHSKDELEFGVVTHNPDEWSDVKELLNCVGVFPSYDTSSQDFIFSLASWAHTNKASTQHVLLIVDGLEAYNTMEFETQSFFRWILARGSSRRLHPVISLDSSRIQEVSELVNANDNHAKIIGYIKNKEVLMHFESEALTPIPAHGGNTDWLYDFFVPCGKKWVRFWTLG